MYIIIGLGMQSKAILHYLLTQTGDEVYSYDPFVTEQYVKNIHNDLKLSKEQISRHTFCNFKFCFNDAENFPKRSVIISCLSPYLNEQIVELCLKYNHHYVDLGGDNEQTRKTINHVKKINCCETSFVPDCGVAPGLVSSIIGEIKSLYGLEDINIYCGGIPEKPTLPLGYVKSFSTQGLIKEYTGVVEYINNGELAFIPALSKIDSIFIKGFGVLEYAPTSGSISLVSSEMRKRGVRNLNYYTLRYPGHWKFVKENILNNSDPINIFDKVSSKVSQKHKDILLLAFYGKSNKDHQRNIIRKYKWEYDCKHNISAMAQITGYTVASVAHMLSNNQHAGIVEMHDISYTYLKQSIEKMPNQFLEIY